MHLWGIEMRISGGHGFTKGDDICLITKDHRWWRRLLFFIASRQPPTITKFYKCGEVTNSTFTLKARGL